MNIRKRTVDSVVVISLDGQLDSHSAPVIQDKLVRMLPPGGDVLLDFTKVGCVSGEGLRIMRLAYRQAQCLDCSVALVGVTPELLNILAATGFLDFFLVADNVPQALIALQAAAGNEEADDEQPALRA